MGPSLFKLCSTLAHLAVFCRTPQLINDSLPCLCAKPWHPFLESRLSYRPVIGEGQFLARRCGQTKAINTSTSTGTVINNLQYMHKCQGRCFRARRGVILLVNHPWRSYGISLSMLNPETQARTVVRAARAFSLSFTLQL